MLFGKKLPGKRKGRVGDGLFECILGRWSDLRAGADFDGKDEVMPGRIMVLLVCSGAVLSALGWYQPFVDFAGAGASVPLLGFGHTLMKGVKEAVEQDGFLGLFTGGFQAGAAGTAAALIFGYLASLIFKPKMKK